MKDIQTIYRTKSLFFVLILFLISNVVMAQADSLQVAQADTTNKDKKKDKKKRKNSFIVYAGLSLNNLSEASTKYESKISPGFFFGASYKQGRFFYWQIGARYNHSIYSLKNSTIEVDTTMSTDYFSVGDIDIPLTVGINILSVTSRILGLRIFVSAIPAFAIGVGDNELGITKDNINTFNIYGQGGVGIDVTFFVLEAGFNYGFNDLFKNDVVSKPGQIFVKLGFRF